MAKLNIKQIAGPVVGARAPTGAVPVFDGNLVRWSNVATTALQVPTGTTNQRPGNGNEVDGMLRYNTDTGRLEGREAGAWTNIVNTVRSFLELTDVPHTYSGAVGKVLAVKADGTGLEYVDPTVTINKITGATLAQAGNVVSVKSDGSGLEYTVPKVDVANITGTTGQSGKYLAVKSDGTGLQFVDPAVTIDKITGTTPAQAGNIVTVKPDGSGLQFSPFPSVGNLKVMRFRINLSGNYMNVTTPVTEIPDGWSFTGEYAGGNFSTLNVVHNMGGPPVYGAYLGYEGDLQGSFRMRPLGTATGEVRVKPATFGTRITILNVGTNTSGAFSDTYTYAYLWFMV